MSSIHSRSERFLRWFLWGVIIGATPFFIASLTLREKPLSELFAHGEAFVYCATLLSALLGEVIIAVECKAWVRTSLGAAVATMLLLCISSYALTVAQVNLPMADQFLSASLISDLSRDFAIATLALGSYTMSLRTSADLRPSRDPAILDLRTEGREASNVGHAEPIVIYVERRP